MENNSKKKFWVEMSIREIWTQAHFAELAYKNINAKVLGGTDAIFSSIHSFLSHSANISKMLAADDGSDTPTSIGDILSVKESSVIHNRRFRNNLEHYDNELKSWIDHFPEGVNIGTYNIGPKSALQVPNFIFVSHFDPSTNTFTFVNKDFDLGVLYTEVKRIKELADSWVSSLAKST